MGRVVELPTETNGETTETDGQTTELPARAGESPRRVADPHGWIGRCTTHPGRRVGRRVAHPGGWVLRSARSGGPFACRAGHSGGEHAGPESVVDVAHRDPGRARVEHREQRRETAERRPVTHARGHREHRYRHQP